MQARPVFLEMSRSSLTWVFNKHSPLELSFVTNFVLPLGIHPDALDQNAQNSIIAESSVLLGSRKPQDLRLYIMRRQGLQGSE